MNFLRAHRLPVAWMLFAFILFNGLACSIGHGLMMGMERASEEASSRHAHAGMKMDMPMEMPMDMSMGSSATRTDPHDSLKAMFGDCTFAGILAMAIVFFAALGWLTRLHQPRAVPARIRQGTSFRLYFPALNPRAP